MLSGSGNERGAALLRRPFSPLFIGVFARRGCLFGSFCGGGVGPGVHRLPSRRQPDGIRLRAGPPRRTRRSGHSPGVLVACLGKGGSAIAVVGSGSRGVPVPSYAAADAAFAEAVAYLSSREAQQMSESDLERELHRTGQELMDKLLQGHREQRDSLAEAAGPVERTDEVDVIELSQRRVAEGPPQTTTSPTVQVARQTHSSVAQRRRDALAPPPPCATATSQCGTAHHRPTGERRDGRRVCPTAVGGIGVIRDSDAVEPAYAGAWLEPGGSEAPAASQSRS